LILGRHLKTIRGGENRASPTGGSLDAGLSKNFGSLSLHCFVVLGSPGEFRDTVRSMRRAVRRCRYRKTGWMVAEILTRAFGRGYYDPEKHDAACTHLLAFGSQLADVPPTKRTIQPSEHREKNRPLMKIFGQRNARVDISGGEIEVGCPVPWTERAVCLVGQMRRPPTIVIDGDHSTRRREDWAIHEAHRLPESAVHRITPAVPMTSL
jgi:hypothetical protein